MDFIEWNTYIANLCSEISLAWFAIQGLRVTQLNKRETTTQQLY